MNDLVLVKKTLTFSQPIGWNSLPLNLPEEGRVVEVYVSSEAGGTLDVLAVGSVATFSDAVLPQVCAYYAEGVAVPAAPGLFSDVVLAGGIWDQAGRERPLLGVKASAEIEITVTVGVMVRP